MIIIPKQLTTLVSAQDTKGLGLDSEEFSQICEKSLTWRGKDFQSRTWLQRWKRVNWMKRLCSLTLRPSHTENFVDLWTSYLAASRANPSVLLESVKALKTHDTCSPTSEMESQSADLDLFSWRTSKESSLVKQQKSNQFSNMSLANWKAWVTKQRQEYSQRLKLVHHTKGSEFSSWATPTCHLAKEGAFPAEYTRNTPTLTAQAVGIQNLKQWPTPSVGDEEKRRMQGSSQASKSLSSLAVQGKLMSRPNGLQDQRKPQKNGSSQEFCLKQKTKSTRLNPNWVEQLMGVPVKWTDLGSWGTE